MEEAAADRARHQRMRDSLDGLSIGDAVGRALYLCPESIRRRELPPPRWPTTDDTEMACAIVDELVAHGSIDPDRLATGFADRFMADTERGYGATAYMILHRIATGSDWREVSGSVYRGTGSRGNGAAMRVAPLGAFFSDDLAQVVDQARQSAIITHMHDDGVAGAIAVALAAAWANCQNDSDGADGPGATDPRESILAAMPPGPTRDRVAGSCELPVDTADDTLARELGTGVDILASDSVPLAIWCAVHHCDNFEDAIWRALDVCATDENSDTDTISAMVGGIVGSAAPATVPDAWRAGREPLRLAVP